jgi:hypothetical protein
MRAVGFVVLGIGLLVLAAALDLIASVPRGAVPPTLPVTLRIWLSSFSMLIFAAVNFAYATVALKELQAAKWAAFLIAAVGLAGALYLPLWGLGLPWLSQLLSSRWNPLTAIVARGGFISLFKLQAAVLLVLGSAALLVRRRVARESPGENAG